MSQLMAVVVNGQAVIEYDRRKSLSAQQQQYLQRMDQQMAAGIELGGEFIAQPDQQQCAQFVTLQLFEALQQDNEQQIAAMVSYLANRLPDLRQVKADLDQNSNTWVFDLVFDQAHIKNQVHVSFSS